MATEQPFDDAPNPYAADAASQFDTGNGSEDGPRRGWVGHIPAIGILLIIQSVLQMLLAVYLIVLPFFFGAMLDEALATNPALQQQQDFSPEQIKTITLLTYTIMGGIGVIFSPVQLVGGIQILRFKWHTMGVVAVSSGFLTFASGCWCFPTGLFLGIYGMLVLLNEPVKRAFQMRAEGRTVQEVKAAFRGLPK